MFSSVVVVIVLLAVYGSSLTHTYLFADETWLFSNHMVNRSLLQAIGAYTLNFGRPFLAPVHHFMSDLVIFGDAGLMALRIGGFVLSALVANLFLALLYRQGLSLFQATLLTLFIWAQPAFAIAHLYAHITAAWGVVLLSLLAFWLVVDRQSPLSQRAALPVAFFLFLVGFFSSQIAAFFCVSLIALASLRAPTHDHWSILRNLFVAAIAAFAAYVLFYFVTKAAFGWFAYRGGATLGVSLSTLRVFEFWNYPRRISATDAQVLMACLAVGVLWVLVTVLALVRERSSPVPKWRRWGLAHACVASSFIVVIADGSSGRQHLFLATVPALTIVAWFSMHVLFEGIADRTKLLVSSLFVAVVLVGAGLSYSRDLVTPAASMYAFIGNELRKPGSESGPIHVFVPKPSTWRGICSGQPCGGFYGRRFQLPWHLERPSYYTSVLRFSGRPWNRTVNFIDPTSAKAKGRPDVDWRVYLRQKACAGALNPKGYACPFPNHATDS